MGDKYRMRCIGGTVWATVEGHTMMVASTPRCGWIGIRTDHVQCECYDINRMYCRALTPGPGCPRGIDWPCPRCKGSVTGKPVERRQVAAHV